MYKPTVHVEMNVTYTGYTQNYLFKKIHKVYAFPLCLST